MTMWNTPKLKLARRLLLEEVRDREIEVIRERCHVQMLQAGVHPQQELIESLCNWEDALKTTYGCKREPQDVSNAKPR